MTMADKKMLVDTNILIYASNEASPFYQDANRLPSNNKRERILSHAGCWSELPEDIQQALEDELIQRRHAHR